MLLHITQSISVYISPLQYIVLIVTLVLHEGDIYFAELRCDNGRHLLNPAASEAFTIPDNFLKCSVFVKGADGTRFSLMESGETRAF